MFFFRIFQFRVDHIQFSLIHRWPAENHQFFSNRVVFGNPFSSPEPNKIQASAPVGKISHKPLSPSLSYGCVSMNLSFDLYKGHIGCDFRYFIELAPVHITVRIVG